MQLTCQASPNIAAMKVSLLEASFMPVDDSEESLPAVDEGNAAAVDCVVKEEVFIDFL